MSAIHDLAEFVSSATEQFRKGDAVSVDVGFFIVGFTEHAAAKNDFIRLLREALPEGEYHQFTVDEFLGGPSYITSGAWIGDQGLAMRLYALLEHYGLADVVTPATLGVEGEAARELLGSGFVMFAAKSDLKEALA